MVVASALYSDLVELYETVVCFLFFQDIKEMPRKIQKPVSDLLESMRLAQSASLKACRDSGTLAG